MTREDVADQAGRVAGTINNLIPNIETHINAANKCKPLDAARKTEVKHVNDYIVRLKEERKKLEGIIKTFKALSPHTDPAKQKTGIKGLAEKLSKEKRADAALLKKMEAALKDVDTAIKNSESMKVAAWKVISF